MIYARFAVSPSSLAINQARRCKCTRIGHGKSRPGSYATPSYKAARESVRTSAQRQWFAPVGQWDGAVYPDGPVHARYVMTTKSQHRQGPAQGMPLLDVDAPEKGLWDALNGVAYTDDSQIVEFSGRKVLGDEDGIEVWVYRPGEEIENAE